MEERWELRVICWLSGLPAVKQQNARSAFSPADLWPCVCSHIPRITRQPLRLDGVIAFVILCAPSFTLDEQ